MSLLSFLSSSALCGVLCLAPAGAGAQDTANLPAGQLTRKGDVPASYPGGPKAWQTYLVEAFDRQVLQDTAIRSRIPAGRHQAVLRFIVGKNGTVTDVSIVKGIGYGADEALVKIFRNSLPWTPASRKGKNVASYHAQPFQFIIEAEE